jgi:hypothetical protein
LIIGALIVSAILGAVVLFNLATPEDAWSTSRPYTRAEAPLTRAELRQVLSGGVGPDLAAEESCPGPALYDAAGLVQDLAWLEVTYGAVSWQCAEAHPDAEYLFRLTELRASCGPAVIVANVKGENGGPLADRAVVRYWPGAPALPYYDPPASRWTDLGVVGWTGVNGDVGFGLGEGDYYFPETGAGVTEMYVADYDGPSDLVAGLGMLGGTDHCTLFPTWHRIPKEDVIPPTATPGPTEEPIAIEGLYRIEELYIKLATPAP